MKCLQASDIGDLTKQIQDLMDGSLPDEGWGADCLVLCESVNFLSEIANRGDLHNQFPSNPTAASIREVMESEFFDWY